MKLLLMLCSPEHEEINVMYVVTEVFQHLYLHVKDLTPAETHEIITKSNKRF